MAAVKKIFFALLVCLLFGNTALAKWEVPITNRAYGISTSTNFMIDDVNFFTSIQPMVGWQSTYKNQSVINRVVLGVDKDQVANYYTAFTLNVDIQVITTDENNLLNTQFKTLRISYDPVQNVIENSISIYEFTGGLRVDVQVLNMYDDLGNPVGTSPLNVYLESFIQVDRYEIFNPAVPLPSALLPFIAGQYEERTITIPGIAGAESYDVEWLFIDRNAGQYMSPFYKYDYSFRHDGSRLNVKTNSVKIPMIYPEGLLLVRYRAIGVPNLSVTQYFENGVWSIPESGELYIDYLSPSSVYFSTGPLVSAPSSFYYEGYSPGLNWQRQASFAEDGKNKQIISYYDGILRDRQSVTRNNTDNLPIVGQKIYDFMGRPAIEILPVPDPDNSSLQLRTGFNTSADIARQNRTYSYKDFDLDVLASCVESRTARMDSANGASKYYSTNNSLPLSIVNRALIPHAELYPFVQTEYTPDNTGRIRRQGGVGPTHRLTGIDENGNPITGHETKYYYSTPAQEELDRLFANEVGNANHYKKQIVVDANGQQSVSYLDPQGRVIATGLIGNPANTPNMIPLDNVSTRNMNIDLLQRNMVLTTERTITSSYTFYAPDAGTYSFDYSFTAPQHTETCLPPGMCMDCIYKLSLSVRSDDCDEEYVPIPDREQVVGTIDSICGSSITFHTSAPGYNILLPKGNYVVTKRLTIDENALEYYKEVFLRNNQCIKTYEDFLEEERAKIDFDNCNYTCEKCNADIEKIRIENGWTLSDPLFLEIKKGCDEICAIKTPCFALLEMMKTDMSPGGQYFNNINNTSRTIDPDATDPFALASDYSWLDNVANITLSEKNQIFADILTNYLVSINSWAELEEKWNPDYVEYLLPYHPEYCYYQECIQIENSYLYDDDMLSTDDWQTAKTKGYYNPIGTNLTGFDLDYPGDYTSNLLDPFFEMTYNAARKTAMNGDLTNYITDPGYTDPENSAWKAMELAMAELGTKSCFNNYAWNAFRAMYLSQKQKYYKSYYESKCTVTIASNFTRRFIFDNAQAKVAGGNDSRFDNLTDNNPTNISNAINTEINNHCDEICNNYADNWMAKLKNCAFSFPGDSATIRNHFVEICKKGCDVDNPFGSRSLKPGQTYQFANFKEVLTYYGLYVQGVCDDILIEWPMYYNHDYFAQLSPYADTCACKTNKNIKDIKCKITGPVKDTCLCNSGSTTLGKAMLIGAGVEEQYQCKNCIDCYKLSAELKKFFAAYPANWSYTNTAQFNTLLKNFLNLNLSMNMDYEDYALFAAQCLGQEETGIDSMSFYRLSRYKYIYVPGSTYSPSFTSIISPFPSDVMVAQNEQPTRNRVFELDNSDKSTWLASLDNHPYSNRRIFTPEMEKTAGPNAGYETWQYEAEVFDNIQGTTKTLSVSCNCTEVMRAHALWKTGKLRTANAMLAYQVLHGYTFSDFNDKLQQCCYMFNSQAIPCPPFPPNPPTCNFNEDAFLNLLQSGGTPTFASGSPFSCYPVHGQFADEPCPPDESICNTQKVTLDRCGCENLLALKDKFPGITDPVQLRAKLEMEYGLNPGTLPPDFDPWDLINRCEDFFYTGTGDDPNGNPIPRGSNIPNPNPPPPMVPNWSQEALDDLDETSYDEELEIPRILSCNPYCQRPPGPPLGGGGGYTPPKITIPEPPKCKTPSCSELVDLFKEYLDSVGIPHGGPFDPPLLPQELQGEYEFRKFILDYQTNATGPIYPVIPAWAPYFPPGKQTKDIFKEINASITTKLIAIGYCNIESQRPFKEPGETFDYFLRLFMCMGPNSFSQQECSLCIQTNDTLEKIQLWINRLAKDDLDILYRSNKRYRAIPQPTKWVPQFYQEFYAGGSPHLLVQDIWSQKIPLLRYNIEEGSTLKFDLLLSYVNPYEEDKYNWRYIKYFHSIEMMVNSNCQPTDMFRIKARLELAKRYKKNNPNCPIPADPCYEDVELIGYVMYPAGLLTTNITPVPCPPCSTLCNRPYMTEPDTTDPCRKILDDIAETNAQYRYQQYVKDVLDSFEKRYVAKCLAPIEQFNLQYTDYEYQYTLYHYDQADNLIKTVPPAAVVPITNAVSLANIKSHRAGTNPTREYPIHFEDLITSYKYNTLSKLIEQHTPDGGTRKFWYDKLGRLVLSQNAKQAAIPPDINGHLTYSYTEYDELGRIYEIGEILIDPGNTDPDNIANNITTLLVAAQTTKTQITRTIYDLPIALVGNDAPSSFVQQNTRNRVALSIYMDTWSSDPNDMKYATHYNYDMLGNVKQIVQDFPELDEYHNRYKLIEYNFDLASGRVNMISYQPTDAPGDDPKLDRFFHYYEYDADNRIVNTYTSRRPAVEDINTLFSLPDISTTTGWTRDAKYFYYPHNPLARYEIGEEKVQGVDYAYNIHGWIKSLNSGLMQPDYDPGRDADVTFAGPNLLVGRDAFGLELGYYQNDYYSIAPANNISGKIGSNIGNDNVDLFNGNISHMITSIPDITQWQAGLLVTDASAQLYRYDQLNRLKTSRYYTNDLLPANNWDNNGVIPDDYLMELSYDPNGNITYLHRMGLNSGVKDMDELTYQYTSGTNQLDFVDDNISSGNYAIDIDDQNPGNYGYDEIGNLIKDDAEEIASIEWTLYGKIKRITRIGSSTKPDLAFEYNSSGQRIKKTVISKGTTDGPVSDYYVRDAGGNLITLYTLKDAEQNPYRVKHLYTSEFDIYGNSRIGIINDSTLLAEKIYEPGPNPGEESLIQMEYINWQRYEELYGDVLDSFTLKYGYRKYELTNHLGNVHVTVTDRKLSVTSGTAIDYYTADIVTISDYYAFGMLNPDKDWSSTKSYKYGFNGQEKDNEVSGHGNSNTAEFWQYDSRLGRRWNRDPVMKEWESPYACFANNPICYIDVKGADTLTTITTTSKSTVISATTSTTEFDDEDVKPDDPRVKQAIASLGGDDRVNPVPNSPNYRVENAKLHTMSTTTTTYQTTITYDEGKAISTVTTSTTVTTVSTYLTFEVVNDLDGRSTAYPIKANFMSSISGKTGDPIKNLNAATPHFINNLANEDKRIRGQGGGKTINDKLGGYEGVIAKLNYMKSRDANIIGGGSVVAGVIVGIFTGGTGGVVLGGATGTSGWGLGYLSGEAYDKSINYYTKKNDANKAPHMTNKQWNIHNQVASPNVFIPNQYR